MPLPDRYVAYTVVVPTVSAMRGVPLVVSMVTDSLKLTVKSRFWPATYQAFEGTATEATVGATSSATVMVMASAYVALAASVVCTRTV